MPLPDRMLDSGGAGTCTLCGASNRVRVFPAAVRTLASARPETALVGEAACFDHPGKRAVAACRYCGRFVCQLCSVEAGGEIWCPSCVVNRAGNAREANFEAGRPLYDSIALTVPLLSLLIWPFTIVTAPGAVVFSILKWKAPMSPVRRFRWRFVAAIFVGLSMTAGWIVGLVYLLAHRSVS